jgi:thiamine-monophosphate kinase
MKMPGEFDYIRWIRAQIKPAEGVVVGPGDDCAVVRTSGGLQLITTDMLMDGVDFKLGEVEPRRIGRKAMAVNLSDIAAMAGVPRTAVVSVALPIGPGTPKLAEELFSGMHELATRFGVSIIGGDTNAWHGPLTISVTLHGDVTERGYVTRGGAEPGDWLFVTGPLGGSIRGRHLDFTPRVAEALALNDRVKLKAMIDISDGLTADLQHILQESGCGANITCVPLNPGVSLEQALGDGEDFELLYAVSPQDGATLPPEWKIGECIEKGLHYKGSPLTPKGWVHPLD